MKIIKQIGELLKAFFALRWLERWLNSLALGLRQLACAHDYEFDDSLHSGVHVWCNKCALHLFTCDGGILTMHQVEDGYVASWDDGAVFIHQARKHEEA